ncbi:MAG: ABC transporter substrate-binding protein [Thermoanaerobaculaceae bacterium]
MRPEARFHNGKPCTAQDVVASFLRAKNHPHSQIRHLLQSVTRVEVESTQELTIATAAPSPTLLKNLVFVLVVLKNQCGQEEITVPMGTGPYRVAKRENSGIQIQAVSWQGRMPQIRRAKIVFIGNDEERTKALLAGKVDVCSWPREEDLGEVRSRRDLRLVRQPRLAVQLLAITPSAGEGVSRQALADVRVRRALLLALDRERLVQEGPANNGTVASQLVHPLVFGYDPSIRPVPYDPVRAKALLAEAGFAQGFSKYRGGGHGHRPADRPGLG